MRTLGVCRVCAAALAALWLAACALVGAHAKGPSHKGTKATTSFDAVEDEVESAEYAVVIEHSSGWRCGGALISLQVALSTADCVRGARAAVPATTAAEDLWVPAPVVQGALWARAPVLPARDAAHAAPRITAVPLKDVDADLWVHASAPGAPHADAARRVTRVALAFDTEKKKEYEKRAHEPWLAAVADLALLELEAPFGAAAHARPILMATSPEECAPRVRGGAAPECLAVRTPRHARGALLAATTALATPDVCAERAPHWDDLDDKVLCFTGGNLCPRDWGVGVVCGGKLCGVLSRSVRSGHGAAGARGCGDTHAAQLVPQWRDFIHCAQPAGQCGRGSCASVCHERLLQGEPGDVSGETATSPTETRSSQPWKTRLPTHSALPFRFRGTDAGASRHVAPTRLGRQQSLFDRPKPNIQLRLKAGEYVDDSASYESSEESPKSSLAMSAPGHSEPTEKGTIASPNATVARAAGSDTRASPAAGALRSSAPARPRTGDPAILILNFLYIFICHYK